MKIEDRRKWEKKNNFTSYKTVIEDIYSKFAKLDEDSYEDEIEFYNIIENNNDIIEIKNDAIVEKVKFENYHFICNRSGIFQNSTYINKIESNSHHIYSIEDYKKNTNFEELVAVKPDDFDPNNAFGTTSLEASYTNDNFGCKNDRRLTVYFVNYYQSLIWDVRKICAGGEYSYTVTYNVDAPEVFYRVFGSRKRFCKWTNWTDEHYTTNIQILKAECTVYGFENDENLSYWEMVDKVEDPNTSVYYNTGPSSIELFDVYMPTGAFNEVTQVFKKDYFSDAIVNEISVGSNYVQNYTGSGFEKVEFKATSRGIGNNFVELSY